MKVMLKKAPLAMEEFLKKSMKLTLKKKSRVFCGTWLLG